MANWQNATTTLLHCYNNGAYFPLEPRAGWVHNFDFSRHHGVANVIMIDGHVVDIPQDDAAMDQVRITPE